MKEAIYNSIGSNYNHARAADPYLLERISELLKWKKDGKYLDIGCGTGNYTSALSQKGLEIIGVDPSEIMLKEAYKKGDNVLWVKGQAESLPFNDEHFDGILGTLTLHHWSDLEKGFQELHRVVKSSGKVVFFIATPEQTDRYWLKHYFPDIIRKSVDALPSMNKIQAAAKKAGFSLELTEKYEVKEDLKDHFFYVGKHDPTLYFDDQIRNGISSFSALSNKKEVELGLEQLKKDINSGTFADIKNSYAHDEGDYLFAVFEN